jgi:MSHA biogenesis protein MshP
MKHQHGFGAIAAIMILVILAALAAAIVSLGTTQQASSALDLMSSRAWQAVRAGNEYGLFRTKPGNDWEATCDYDFGTSTFKTQTATLDLTTDTGLYVTIYCDSWVYNEGEETNPAPPPDLKARTARVYQIRAIACPVAAGCTGVNDGSGPFYVERARSVIAIN